MKRLKVLFVLTICIQFAYSNLLYDLVDGKYKPNKFIIPVSMNDGEYFTQKVNNNSIVKYSYKNGNTIDTIFSVNQIKDCPIKKITGYTFSPNETKILVYTNEKYRYRRTFKANYYVYDVKRKELKPLSDEQQEVPLFSPDSRYIAFARNNNLYMKKLDFDTEITITKDGEAGKIINGTPDWVYEEEFQATRHFVWSPDSKLLAFTKFDETEIPEFSFQFFVKQGTGKGTGEGKEEGGVTGTGEELELYPSLFSYKYPKAGSKNSKVSVCVYDDFNKTTRFMQLPDADQDFYVPCIRWTNSVDQLAIFKLNRNQNRLDMLFANPRTTICKLILRQDDKYYVDYDNIDFIHFTTDNQYFFGVSEQDGYRHIYQYRINGTMLKQITKGKWDITNFYGYDETNKTIYYQSAELSATQRDIYKIDAKDKKLCLTDGKGIHLGYFNSNFSYLIDDASSVVNPNTITLRNNLGKSLRVLENNQTLKADFAKLQLPNKEFFSFTTSENIKLNGWMVKPVDFNANTKYPVLQVQYSGPDSQEALDKWNVGWEYYLSTKGYIVVCVDGRGTGGRGVEFRKCTYQQLGIFETKDQIESAKYLGNLNFVDKNRIGIWGWSYGGSMVLWSMSSSENIFKAGIAVAPVTDWKLYNTAYTERFMRRPQENFAGYDKTSAISMADKLNGKLLIVHGTADDNVHIQNTMLYIDKLVAADKQFEMQLYTDKNHSILGKQTRRHLYTRMSEFLFSNL